MTDNQTYRVIREENAEAKPIWQYADGDIRLSHMRGEGDGRHYLMLMTPKQRDFFSLGSYDSPEEATAAFE